MSGRHTPGPWTVTQYSNYAGWAVGHPSRGCIAERWYKDEKHVSAIYDDGEMEANARLIAAAPDLLEALREITDHLEAVLSGPIAQVVTWPADFPNSLPTIARARLAIAKAECSDKGVES